MVNWKIKHYIYNDENNWTRNTSRYVNYIFVCVTRKVWIRFHSNGGQRNGIVAAKLEAEGVLSSVPDLHIPIAKKGYNGLYIGV